uniref:TF-B3 domain-containing protein n=1 Tax=Setaria italica TaxID=4555 RepID=K4ALK6_SETIT
KRSSTTSREQRQQSSQDMGSSCRRCKLRAENAYKNLDDHQKYFLMLMKGDFQQAMTVPVGFVKSFKGEFRGEIKLETRNGESYCVGVVKQPDKVSFSAGWGVFVKTYDLHTDDSFGYEKATSVVVNDESVPLRVQKSSRDDIEYNFPKQYIVRHLGRKERTIFLQRDSQRYQAKLNIGAVAKLSQGGWRRFVKANGIEVGDICLFELLKDGETCTMNVHIIRSYEVAD